MEHNANLVLLAVDVGVDGVTAPLLGRVARGSGVQLLLWGGDEVNEFPPVDFLPPEFCLLSPGGISLFFCAVLAMVLLLSLTPLSLLSSSLLELPAAAASSSLLFESSSLKSSSLESLSFSVSKRWREEGRLDAI